MNIKSIKENLTITEYGQRGKKEGLREKQNTNDCEINKGSIKIISKGTVTDKTIK